MRIAIVHDWLVSFGGAENVLAELLNIWPDADLFSVVDFFSDQDRAKIKNKRATTTFIQNFPQAKKRYRNYLPFMPLAIEQLDLSSYDVIISSSHAVAKGVLTGPDQLHISYVHSPIRYAWDLQHQYLRESNLNQGLRGIIAKIILHKIRLWDYRTSFGVDHFIVNSKFVGRRVKKVYGRSSTVIYPPVNTADFSFNGQEKDNFYLTASRLVPYKRVDLIVEAFGDMPDKRLIVIGDGPDLKKIQNLAKPNVSVLGFQSFEKLVHMMQTARAFVFAAEEDFGISPVEAQACGTPVIAYGKGGALETVVGDGENKTGIFFKKQDVKSLCEAVHLFETNQTEFLAADCVLNAAKFSTEIFKRQMESFLISKLQYQD